jgi:hypothetical protein
LRYHPRTDFPAQLNSRLDIGSPEPLKLFVKAPVASVSGKYVGTRAMDPSVDIAKPSKGRIDQGLARRLAANIRHDDFAVQAGLVSNYKRSLLRPQPIQSTMKNDMRRGFCKCESSCSAYTRG